MLNLSRIQLELEKAKEGLREVEETIQKVEGKTFPNGPGRFSNIKIQLQSDKYRNPIGTEDGKPQRRIIASNIETRNRRLPSDDLSFNLKRGPRDKRETGLKRPVQENRPISIAARLTGLAQQPVDDEDDEEFSKKLALPSRVITTTVEAPSRQEVIAAQTGDELNKQRNRRMFGALVGTLQKFCKEETRVREREEKRLKVEKKLEEDAKREKDKLLQEKRELFLERKRREIEIKRIEWSLNRVKEYEAWEANVIPLKKFIQTHAKPHIFYLPSVHNAKTEERLSQSQRIVERMIEKRKNNLKQEIENSEKKAKRTAAEEEEEEEAENIPQNSESTQNVEQPVEIDFDTVNKENGFHEEDSKAKREDRENTEDTEKTEMEEETWSDKENAAEEKHEGHDTKQSAFGDVEDTVSQELNASDNVCIPSEVTHSEENIEGDSYGVGEDEDRGSYKAAREGRTFENEDHPLDNEKKENVDKLTNDTSKSDRDVTNEVPISESENERMVRNEETNVAEEEGQVSPESASLQKSDDRISASDQAVAENSFDEKSKSRDDSTVQHNQDDKNKSKYSGSSTNKELSPVKKSKGSRTYRSPGRRSESPRRFAKTRRRSRSSSRKRKWYTRSKSRSKSASPSKRSRKSRSPRSRRHSERSGMSSSRRKSPSRNRRRSSSKSSRSASPRKRMKFRSPSSSDSRSDSD